MAYITKGISAYYMNTTPANNETLSALGGFTLTEDKGFALPKVQEIGELGIQSAASTYDQIEVTTLEDEKHVYVNGLQADSEGNELTLKFLYDAKYFKFFQTALDLEAASLTSSTSFAGKWQIHIPLAESFIAGDGSKIGGAFMLNANITKVALDSVATNAALTMTITLKVIDIDYETK